MRAYNRGKGLIWADWKLAERNCLLSGDLKEDYGLKDLGKCFWRREGLGEVPRQEKAGVIRDLEGQEVTET